MLESFSSQCRYIPENYQVYLDRFRGLEDTTFVSDDLKTWAHQLTGKMPSELTPDDVVAARKAMQNNAIIQAAREHERTDCSDSGRRTPSRSC